MNKEAYKSRELIVAYILLVMFFVMVFNGFNSMSGKSVAQCTPEYGQCNDGIDNDCDGFLDCRDSDCNGGFVSACDGTSSQGCFRSIIARNSCDLDYPKTCGYETSCVDGLDNDCDGLTDKADNDC